VEVALNMRRGDSIGSRAVGDHFGFVICEGAVAFDGSSLREGFGILSIAAVSDGLREEVGEGGFEFRNIDAVLRALGASDAGLDAGEVEVDVHAVGYVAFFGMPKRPWALK
jgi:hypothetical protein